MTKSRTSRTAHFVLSSGGIMRVFHLVVALAGLATAFCEAAPVTVKDIALMLRMGISEQEILSEVKARKLASPIDAGVSDELGKNGASASLLRTLKSGEFELTAAEASVAAIEARNREEARQRGIVARRAEEERRPAAAQRPPLPQAGPISGTMKDLQQFRNGKLQAFDASKLARTRVFALYYSAHWCGPCRKFTPQLVDFYNRYKPSHPEFELIFVSSDRSPREMEKYAEEAAMPWPMFDFETAKSDERWRGYSGRGIPCLVLIDGNGQVLSHSYRGEQYVGPAKVVEDLVRIMP